MLIRHYACCNGDTWASEVGVLSKSRPRLITTWNEVPAGTNGGMSKLGTLASILGGTFIGVIFYITSFFDVTVTSASPAQWPIIFIGTFGGFAGSLVSVLFQSKS